MHGVDRGSLVAAVPSCALDGVQDNPLPWVSGDPRLMNPGIHVGSQLDRLVEGTGNLTHAFIPDGPALKWCSNMKKLWPCVAPLLRPATVKPTTHVQGCWAAFSCLVQCRHSLTGVGHEQSTHIWPS
jgi:hypothetical protein